MGVVVLVVDGFKPNGAPLRLLRFSAKVEKLKGVEFDRFNITPNSLP